MRRSFGLRALALLAAVLSAGCSGEDEVASPATTSTVVGTSASAAPTTTATAVPETSTTAAPAATTAPLPEKAKPERGVLVVGAGGARLAHVAGGEPYGRLRADVAVSYDAVENGWARALTPCEKTAWVPLADGRVERAANVVLDPGHGGGEPGAVGASGLMEKDLNADVVYRVAEKLRAENVTVVVTRPADYRVTIVSRVAIAAAVDPRAFVSVHHNAVPDESRDTPGTEIFYQYRSADSKRLAGLLHEELTGALAAFGADWVADFDAGAKWRLNDSGGDYYGILRRAGQDGVVAVLAEAAFLSNPAEEALLFRDDVRDAEAAAVTRALLRYLRSDDPGSGFTTPYPRTEPAGPGGGATGCEEPG